MALTFMNLGVWISDIKVGFGVEIKALAVHLGGRSGSLKGL